MTSETNTRGANRTTCCTLKGCEDSEAIQHLVLAPLPGCVLAAPVLTRGCALRAYPRLFSWHAFGVQAARHASGLQRLLFDTPAYPCGKQRVDKKVFAVIAIQDVLPGQRLQRLLHRRGRPQPVLLASGL